MKISKIVICKILLFSIICFGCTNGYKITHTDYDKTNNFLAYQSFAWIQDKDTSNNQYDNSDFRSATIKYFSKEISKCGYILKTDTPDILIQLNIYNAKRAKHSETRYSSQKLSKMSEEDKMRSQSDPTINGSDCNNPNNYYYSTTTGKNYVYTYISQQTVYMENSITINIIDRKQNKVVWTATTEADLYEYDAVPFNPNPIVRQLLKSFPVKMNKQH